MKYLAIALIALPAMGSEPAPQPTFQLWEVNRLHELWERDADALFKEQLGEIRELRRHLDACQERHAA